jgi:hypothetical protein
MATDQVLDRAAARREGEGMAYPSGTGQNPLPPLMTVTGGTLVLASRAAPGHDHMGGRRRAPGPGPLARLVARFRGRAPKGAAGGA